MYKDLIEIAKRIIAIARARENDKSYNNSDFAGDPDSPIVATADGVVRHTGWVNGYGQAVLIDHGLGYSTLYAHATGIKVKAADRVKRGQQIAFMGTTGRSTGTTGTSASCSTSCSYGCK